LRPAGTGTNIESAMLMSIEARTHPQRHGQDNTVLPKINHYLYGQVKGPLAMATMMDKQLAELIAGGDVPMPREKLSPFAFHAFCNPGIAWHTGT